jgi:hypothetical protein
MTQPNMAAPSADDLLLGGGAPSVSFKNIGDVIEGPVVAKDAVHKQKFGTGEKDYKDGNPVWQVVLTLQTNLRDPERYDDDGKRRIFFSPQMKQELGKALKAHGAKALPLGAIVRIRFERTVPSQGGGQPKKEYSVSVTLPADTAIAQEVQQQAPVGVLQQTPVQQQYAPVQQFQAAPVQQAVTTAPATPVQQVQQQVPAMSPELAAVLQQMAAQQQAATQQ